VLEAKQSLIRSEIADGTGASIDISVSRHGRQSGIRIWFSDLGRARSPIVDLHPIGLTRFRARLSFGTFATLTIEQMLQADAEERQLSHALLRSIAETADVTISGGQSLDNWTINGSDFSVCAERRGISNRFGDEALAETCRDLVIPLLGAMAELYGYDHVELSSDGASEHLMEGALSKAVVNRRERNPRNRLLCLRIHSHICAVCGLQPNRRYGDAGAIIEVHHLQPLSLAGGPRPYSPEVDLVPLCPCCHRAVHTRRPLPWTLDELSEKLNRDA
jgi:5-methylcytosine-specific restriction protein A